MPQLSFVPRSSRPLGPYRDSTALGRRHGAGFLGGLGLAVALLLAGCGKQAPAPEPERYVRTQVLGAQDSVLVKEFAGEVKARVESRLAFRVGGKVLKRQVNLGEVVRPGQVLAQLDSQDLLLGQEAAKAAMQAARVNRDTLGSEYKRFIELKQQGFISAAELERRENAFKAAQAQLEQARAQADVQINQAGYALLRADAPGVVTGVDAEPGMVVGAGTPIVRVAHDGPRDIHFSVPENQLTQFRAAAGEKGALRVKLWGHDGEPVDATVRELSAAADPVTRTFLVKAEAQGLDARLGQTATVLLRQQRKESAIKLPLSAVMEVQGRTSAWVLDPQSMTVKPVPVTVAGADGNEVVVSQGLQPGQEIVTAGVHVLTPGQKVKRYQQAAR